MLFVRYFVIFVLLGCSTASRAQLVYLVTNFLPTELVLVDMSNGCSTTFIGPITDQGGNPVAGLDIAMCPDGTIYVTNGFDLFTVDPTNAQATLVGSLGGAVINSLACDGNGQLYGAGVFLYSINPSNANATFLGLLPFPAGGDLVFYDGTPYYVSLTGLYEVNLSNPASSPLVMNVSNAAWGLAGYYDGCNQLISGTPGGEMYLLDLTTQTQTLLCSVPFLTTGMASLDDFNLPAFCDTYEIDLDANDSSGASDFDFNAPGVNCTNTSAPIADSDVTITTGQIIDEMTITLTNPLDGPLEFLTLNPPPPNILVTGNGSGMLTLVNLGPATVADFEAALAAVVYQNNANPPTTGQRAVTVMYEASNGGISNTATAFIPVTGSTVVVELGPAQLLCDGETALLDAGNPGLSYQWSTGQQTQTITVSTAGLYSVTVTDANGCTATDNVLVNYLPLTTVNLSGDVDICIGQAATLTVTVNGTSLVDVIIENQVTGAQIPLNGIVGTVPVPVVPPVSSTYEIISVLPSGATACVDTTATGMATVTVSLPSQTQVDTLICAGDSLFLENAWQTQSGTYFDTLQSLGGCDSILVTELDLLPIDTTQIATVSCDSTQVGTFEMWLPDSNGCDSLVIETITYGGALPVFLTETSCNPGNVGLDTLLLNNQFGCDSLIITETILSLADTTQIAEQSCDPNAAGTFEEPLQNSEGCDSLVITTVTFIPPDTTQLSDITCDPAQAGIFEELLINQFGCDSLVITTVDLLPSDTTDLTDQTCDPNAAGVFEDILVNQFGCDSLVTTTITYLPPDTTQLSDTSCDPAQAGIFEEILTNQSGCDSLVITTIDLLPSDTVLIDQTSCDPNQVGTEEVLLNNQFGCDSLLIITTTFAAADTTQLETGSCDPNQTGIFAETLTGADGCDSVIITTVLLFPTNTTSLSATTCDPQQVGVTQDLLSNQFGCDSLVVTTTSLLSTDTTFSNATTCDPQQAGVTQDVLQNQFGCDSLVITETSLLPSDTTLLFAASCNPQDTGTVEIVLTNQFGCDSLLVTTTSLLSTDTTFSSATTCDPQQVGVTEDVLQNQFGCDSLVITETSLLPSDTTLLFAASCNPQDTGTVEIVLINQFGCDSLLVTTTSLLSTDTTFSSATTCDPQQVGVTEDLLLNQFGCDSLVITTTSLLPSDTTFLTDFSCLPTDTGLVVTTFANQFGCDSLVFLQTDLLPPSECALEVVVVSDTVGCDTPTGSLSLNILSGDLPISWSWASSNGDTDAGTFSGPGNELVFSDLPVGDYDFSLTDANGLLAIVTGNIVQADPPDFQLAVETDYNGFAVSCPGADDGAASVTVLSGGVAPFSLLWGNGTVNEQISGLPAGWMSLTVTDVLGCTRTDSVLLEEPDLLGYQLGLSDPSCFAENSGAIEVLDLSGGVPPVEYALNGGTWQTTPFFSDLGPGNYLLEVSDANGCTVENVIVFTAPPEVLVDLGLDTTLVLGDSIMLEPVVNLPAGALDSIYWSGVDCVDCNFVTVTPLVSSSYSVTVVDSLGCRGVDSVNVFVDKSVRVFVPNAFSPDADGINDQFTLFTGPEVRVIRQFSIFSRWGEEVFRAAGVPPNRPDLGWDGRFRGMLLNPGVFVYWAELELIDGSRLIIKGDVTLMR